MVNKGRLKMALAAEKGTDFKTLNEKKKAKERRKKNPKLPRDQQSEEVEDDLEGVKEDAEDEGEDGDEVEEDGEEEEGEEEEEEEDEEADGTFDVEGIDDSESSESEIEMEAKIERKPKSALKAVKPTKQDESEDEEDEEEEDIPMSDLEELPDEEKEDIVPHTRLTINNTTALKAALSRISIATDNSVPFATHQSIMSAEPTADSIEDIQDDLKRELAFYAQSLDAAKRARTSLKAERVPFSRPNDYFAEMIKDDGHMEKVKAKLIEEASAKKAAQDARKLRDLKKFGKQVQVAKLQERQKAKRDTLDKVKMLKRKRQENSGDIGANEAELFDVGVDDELQRHSAKKAFSRGQDGERVPNAKRQKKNERFGFGGKKRYSKSGDAASSGDLSGFNARRMKTGAKGKTAKTARLGKSRRKSAAAKR